MDEPTADDLATRVSGYVTLFAAMLTATLAGQLLGVALDAALGGRWAGPPAVGSVLLEGAAGGWLVAGRRGRPLRVNECARLSIGYSLALVAWAAPLALWTLAARAGPDRPPPPIGAARAGVTLPVVALASVAAVTWTALRIPVMRVASVWRSRSGRP